MLNKKIIILALILVSLLTISSVSANEITNETSDLISIENDGEILDVNSSESEVLESNPNGTFNDLASEIANADGELNLTRNYVSNDAFHRSGIYINKQITINGNGFSIINNDGAIFLIAANYVILNNISFIGCYNFYGPTVAWLEGARYGVLSGCSFVNCPFRYSGGAISWWGFKGTIYNCSFVNCSSEEQGGAIYWEAHNGTMSKCSFVNCSASWSGGAVYWYGDNGVLSDCSFVNSYAFNEGGAIWWGNPYFGHNGTLLNCSFVNCSANYEGDAVIWGGDNGTLKDCIFVNCLSSNGAVYWEGKNGNFTKRESAIECNSILFNYRCPVNLVAILSGDDYLNLNEPLIFYLQKDGVSKNFTKITDNDGKVILNDELKDLTIGIWNMEVTFKEDGNYYSSNAISNITVIPSNSSLFISDINTSLDQEISLVANVNSSSVVNEGHVTFFDDDINIGESQVTNGVATLYYPTTAGEHIITAIYNSDNYYSSNGTAILSVAKVSTILNINDVATVFYSNPSRFTVKVLSNSKAVTEGTVNYYVNNNLVGSSKVLTGVFYDGQFVVYINGSEGTSSLNYVANTANFFILKAVYMENDNYLSSEASTMFKVDKMPTTLTGESVIYDFNQSKTFTTILKDDNGKGVGGQTVKIEAIQYSGAFKSFTGVSDSNGVTTFDVGNLGAGMWYILGNFDENNNYLASKFTDKFVVIRMDTTTEIEEISNPQINHTYKLKANIHDEDGKLVKEGIVQFYLDGVYIGSIDLSNNNGHQNALRNGVLCAANPMFEDVLGDENDDLYIEYTPTEYGKYTLSAVYEGTNIYKSSNQTTTFVVKATTSLSAVYNSNTNQIIATLTNNDTGQVIGGGRINFNIDGENCTATTNSRGQAKISTKDLTPGNYIVSAEYKGNSKYTPSSVSATFTVKIATTISAVYDTGSKELIATLINDITVQPILGATITFKINNVTYKLCTDNSGQARLSVAEFPLGTYDAVISYGGNTKYNPASASLSVPVKANTALDAFYDADAKQFVATLTNDIDGEPVSDVDVNVEINGAPYALKTNSNGQVSVSTAGFAPNVYPASVSFTGDSMYNPADASMDVIIDVDTKVSATYKDGILTATLVNEATGKGINGAELLVSFGDVNYTVKTDSNGQAIVSTRDLAPGPYTATVSFDGNGGNPSSTSLDIDVKTDGFFIVEDISVEYGSDVNLVATLINYATGKGIIGATVGFKFNGKSYTNKTDSNGQAKVTISGLNPGNYETTVSYNGNGKYNPAKATFNALVNKITTSFELYYDSETNEVVATLINGATGKGVYGGTVGIFLNNVKNIIVTDKNGQARLSLGNVDPTTFTAYASYAGNTKYFATGRTITPVEGKVISCISAQYNKENDEVVATLINTETDKPIIGGTVSVVVNNVRNTLKTDNNGQVKVSLVDLVPNVYTVASSYSGNSKYTATTETRSIVKL